MVKLHNLTIEWAAARGLLKNGKATTQALKLGSEMGELAGNLITGKSIKDDIGDCLVVMTILAKLQGTDLLDIINSIDADVHATSLSFVRLIKYLGDLQDKSIKGQDYSNELANIANQLKNIAQHKDITIEDCWAVAYDDIKDRQGFLNVDGCFIKSTDANYAEMHLEFLKGE